MSLTCIRRIQVTSYTSFNQLLVLLHQGAEKTGDTYDLTHLKHDWYDKVGLNLKKKMFLRKNEVLTRTQTFFPVCQCTTDSSMQCFRCFF